MRLRELLKRILPAHHEIRKHRQLQFLGSILHDPDIFHLTRRSCAGGVATAFFVAMLPVPGQMVIAAVAAIWFRVNLPIAVVFTWVTNPVTMPPIYYLGYEVGRTLLGRAPKPVEFTFSLDWFSTTLVNIWPSMLMGSVVLGTLAAMCGYLAVSWIWRLSIVRRWERRRRVKERKDAGD